MKLINLLLLVSILLVSCGSEEDEEPASDPNTFISATLDSTEIKLINTFQDDLFAPTYVYVAREDDRSKVLSITAEIDTLGSFNLPNLLGFFGVTYVVNENGVKSEYDLRNGKLVLTKNDVSGFTGTFEGEFRNIDDRNVIIEVKDGSFNF